MFAFKIFIGYVVHLIIYGMVTLISLTMTKKALKYMYSRDFGQLLTNLHPHLQHLICKQEKANIKLNTKSLFIILNKIYPQENLLLNYIVFKIYSSYMSLLLWSTVGLPKRCKTWGSNRPYPHIMTHDILAKDLNRELSFYETIYSKGTEPRQFNYFYLRRREEMLTFLRNVWIPLQLEKNCRANWALLPLSTPAVVSR